MHASTSPFSDASRSSVATEGSPRSDRPVSLDVTKLTLGTVSVAFSGTSAAIVVAENRDSNLCSRLDFGSTNPLPDVRRVSAYGRISEDELDRREGVDHQLSLSEAT